jgi:hypothetical protein
MPRTDSDSTAPPRPKKPAGARFVYSLLALVAGARVPVIASQLGLDCTTGLDLAVEIERRAIPTIKVLALLSDEELRTAAAAWAMNAGRDQLVNGFATALCNII